MAAKASDFGVEVTPLATNLWLDYDSETGAYYRVHAAPSVSGPWSLLSLQLGTNGIGSWMHAGIVATGECFYYRVGRVWLTNSLDSDADHLSDARELTGGVTDAMDPDCDSDSLLDGDEVDGYGSSPTDTESDSDGLADGDEVAYFGTSPGSPFSGATIYYAFPTNEQGWSCDSEGVYGVASVAWTNAGCPAAGSLAIAPAAGTGYGDYYIRDGTLWEDENAVARPIYRAWLYLPGSAPSGCVRVQPWVKSNADGWEAHYPVDFADLVPGQWTAVSWDLSGLNTQVLAQIDEWAMKVCWMDRDVWNGAVFLDTVHALPLPVPTNLPPEITSVLLSTNSVGRFSRIELTIGLTNVARLNPYDPADVNLEAFFVGPTGRTWRIWGFYMEDEGDAYGEGTWKARFAPDTQGTWSYWVSVSNRWGRSVSATSTFTCAASDAHGWVRVSGDDPHYLEHHDGTPFFGVGYCRPYDLDDEGLFQDAAEHGVNLIHSWMAPWDTMLTVKAEAPGLESSTFYTCEQGRAREIDRIIGYAEQHGVKLVFTIWTHDAIRDFNHHAWRKNGSWARAFDQKVDEPEQYLNAFSELDSPPRNQKFFHDPKYKKYQEQLYRYLIARWGCSPAIGLWNLASELYGTYANSIKCVRWQDPEFVTNKSALVGRDPYLNMDTNQVDGSDYTIPWIRFIHGYFKTNDPFGHPTTACNETDQYWDEGFAVVDVPQIHAYGESYSYVTPPIALAKYHHALAEQFDKPAFIGETGSWKWRTYQPSFLRATAWPALCSGAAVTPMMWTVPPFGEYCDPVMGPWLEDMAGEALLLSEFIRDIDFGRLGLEPAAVIARSPSEPAPAVLYDFESGAGPWHTFGTGVVSVAVSTNYPTDGQQGLRMNVDIGTYDQMTNPACGIKTGTVDWDWGSYWPNGVLRMDVYIPPFYHPTNHPDGFLAGINRDPRTIIEVACQPSGGPWNWYSTRNEYSAEHEGWKKLTVGMLYNLEFRLDEILTGTEAHQVREIKFWFGDYGILRGPVYLDRITVGLYPYTTYGMVSSNGEFAVAWIQDREWTNSLNRNATFQIAGLRTGGTYNVEWWNNRRDGINSARNYNAATGTLYVSDVPDFARDIALKIRWVGAIGSTVDDISVGSVSQRNWIVRSASAKVTATLVNQGTQNRTCDALLVDVTDGRVVDTNLSISINAGQTRNTTFDWNCTNATLGWHDLKIQVPPISGETDTNDNVLAARMKVVAYTPPWDPCERLRRWAPYSSESDAHILRVSTNRATEGTESFYVWYGVPASPTNSQACVGFDNVFENWAGKTAVSVDLYREGTASNVQLQLRTGSTWAWHYSAWQALDPGWNTNVTFGLSSNTWQRNEGSNWWDNVSVSGLDQVQQIFIKMTGHTTSGVAYIDNVRLRP